MLRELFLAVAVVAAAAFNAPLTRVPSSPLARCAASSPLRAPLHVVRCARHVTHRRLRVAQCTLPSHVARGTWLIARGAPSARGAD